MDRIFKQQEAFVAMMVKAYNQGEINAAYKPYMEWKQGHNTLPTREEVDRIRNIVSNELKGYYDKYPEAYKEVDSTIYLGEYQGYKEDAEIVAILEAIDAELTNLQYVAQ